MIPIIHPRQTQGIKILTALFLFLLIPLTGKTQLSVFPEKNAIWCVKRNFDMPSVLLYGLTGDTVIQEKQYAKLYQLNDTTLNIDEGDQYIGAIRSKNTKVWLMPTDYDSEILLYEFPENVGDIVNPYAGATFSIYDPPVFVPGMNIRGEVINIEKDLLNRNYYEIIYTSYPFRDEWIEGIGSLNYGLFWVCYLPPISAGDSRAYLVSLKQGDSIVYHNKSVCDQPFCWFGVGVEDTQQLPSIALYPNPVKETLHIDLGETPLPIRFDLFDPQGRITYTQTLTTPYITVVPPPHSKGLHHYRLTGSDGIPLQSGQLLLE